MMKKEIFIFAAFAALAVASEIDDNEQKKRGAGKPNALNAIPTGAQKPDYTYNIYTQNPSAQVNPIQTYQSQVPNSFYPNQFASQYASSNNPDPSHTNSLHTQVSPQTQSTQSQFVPINVVPSQSYQPKYQIVSPKQGGNLQLAFIQQPQAQSPSILPYPHTLFSPGHANHIAPQNSLFGSSGHFSFGPTYQPLSLGGSFIGQPSMVVIPQTHGSLYNNLVYPNPTQSFYNYYPTTSQAKYSYASGTSVPQPNEYDKAQSTLPQSATKDENINVQNSEYISPSDSNTGYKTFTSRSTYSKL